MATRLALKRPITEKARNNHLNAIRSRAGKHRDRKRSGADDPERKQNEGQITGKWPQGLGRPGRIVGIRMLWSK